MSTYKFDTTRIYSTVNNINDYRPIEENSLENVMLL